MQGVCVCLRGSALEQSSWKMPRNTFTAVKRGSPRSPPPPPLRASALTAPRREGVCPPATRGSGGGGRAAAGWPRGVWRRARGEPGGGGALRPAARGPCGSLPPPSPPPPPPRRRSPVSAGHVLGAGAARAAGALRRMDGGGARRAGGGEGAGGGGGGDLQREAPAARGAGRPPARLQPHYFSVASPPQQRGRRRRHGHGRRPPGPAERRARPHSLPPPHAHAHPPPSHTPTRGGGREAKSKRGKKIAGRWRPPSPAFSRILPGENGNTFLFIEPAARAVAAPPPPPPRRWAGSQPASWAASPRDPGCRCGLRARRSPRIVPPRLRRAGSRGGRAGLPSSRTSWARRIE